MFKFIAALLGASQAFQFTLDERRVEQAAQNAERAFNQQVHPQLHRIEREEHQFQHRFSREAEQMAQRLVREQ